jgi:hypothetical protein
VVECLPSNQEALSSYPSAIFKKQKNKDVCGVRKKDEEPSILCWTMYSLEIVIFVLNKIFP